VKNNLKGNPKNKKIKKAMGHNKEQQI